MRLKSSIAWWAAALLAAGAAQAAGHGAHHHGHGGQASEAHPGQGEPPEGVTVEGCWIRALPAHLPSAGYFKVRNASAQPIALVGIRTDAFGHAMLHATHDAGGMSKMTHAGAITIPAGGEFAFTTRNGYHAMLEQSRRTLEVGATEPLSFLFDRGGPLTVPCLVKPPAALE